MANNITIVDGVSAEQAVQTTQTANVHLPHSFAHLSVNVGGNQVDVSNTNPVPGLIVLANGVVANSNRFPIQNPDASGVTAIAGTGSANINGTGTLFSLDTTGYASIAVQVTNAANGSIVSYWQSVDNINWIASFSAQAGISGAGATNSASTSNATGIFVFGPKAQFFKANVTTFSANSSVNVTASYVLRGSLHFPPDLTHVDSTTNLVTWTAANQASVLTQSSNQTNYSWRGAIFYLNITAMTGTAINVAFTVNNIDPVSGLYYPVLVTAPTTANTTQHAEFMVYPGITSTANTNMGLLLSRTWAANVTITGTGGNTSTGQLSYTYIL